MLRTKQQLSVDLGTLIKNLLGLTVDYIRIEKTLIVKPLGPCIVIFCSAFDVQLGNAPYIDRVAMKVRYRMKATFILTEYGDAQEKIHQFIRGYKEPAFTAPMDLKEMGVIVEEDATEISTLVDETGMSFAVTQAVLKVYYTQEKDYTEPDGFAEHLILKNFYDDNPVENDNPDVLVEQEVT